MQTDTTTFGQRELQDSLQRVLEHHHGFEARRATVAGPAGWSRAAWQRFADLGLAALLVPERYGGLGGGQGDAAVVSAAFGRSLVLEPWLGSAVLATTALVLSGDTSACAEVLPLAAAGELVLAYAHDEAGSDGLGPWVETRAVGPAAPGGSWRLEGVKSNVLHGADAGRLVVSARLSGAADDARGVGLFLVDGAAEGMVRHPTRLIDDTPAAQVVLGGVAARLLSADAAGAVEGVRRVGVASACAQVLGAAEAACGMTTAYVNVRQQFGRAIGQNQAVRHRVAEMLLGVEDCRSAASMACAAAGLGGDDGSAGAELLRAKLLAGRYGRFVCEQAVQLHGGIGMTEEYAVGHFLRRVVVMDQLLGEEGVQALALGRVLVGG